MEIYLKISKLLLAHKTQNISAQETEELLAWRQEKTENEELFQKISQADGFEQFRQQYEEYDFTPKFLLLEQKIKQEKRKRIIKRLSYAAILLPFIFAIWEIIQFQNQGTTPTEYSSIAPGSSKAILTIGKDKTIYIEMNNAQANLYEQRRVYYKNQVEQSIAADGIQKSQFVIFQALNELRQIASIPEKLSNDKITSPKLNMLTETLLNTVANGHKAVVFFNFIAGLDMLGDTLEAKGIDYVCMTGSTRDRKMVVERFQNNEQCKVMLMTLKTGGVGLNLTAADTVFIFEPWWNKAAEEQAINRLHRFGQKAKVLCFSLITQDTIEEKIQQLQQQKSELFSALINSDSSSSKQLSEEDIKFILG